MKDKKDTNLIQMNKISTVTTIIGFIFLIISIIPLFIPSALKQWSFAFLSVAILIVFFNQYKEGLSEGAEAKEKKFIKKLFLYFSFFYFVIKLFIEAYKSLNVSDPFVFLESSDSTMNEILGQVTPLLLSYGVAPVILDIIAIVFSNYITIILISIIFLKEVFQEDGSIYAKLNVGLLVMFLWFAEDAIHFPFFTMVLSILYIAGWFLGNIHGDLWKKFKEEVEKT